MLHLVRTQAVQCLAHRPLPLARQWCVYAAGGDDLKIDGQETVWCVETMVLEVDEDAFDVLVGNLAVGGEGAECVDAIDQGRRDASWEACAFFWSRVAASLAGDGGLCALLLKASLLRASLVCASLLSAPLLRANLLGGRLGGRGKRGE